MRTTFKTSGERVHVVLTVTLLAACAANLVLVWVGFGTPKQQAWVKQHKHLIRRGVILTVGFAFDVNAGMKPDAPDWMQGLGLTWIFRLCSEPRRLGPRYLRYNLLFLWYLLLDGLRGRAWGKELGLPRQP